MAGLVSMVCPGEPYISVQWTATGWRDYNLSQGPDHHGVIVQYWMLIP